MKNEGVKGVNAPKIDRKEEISSSIEKIILGTKKFVRNMLLMAAVVAVEAFALMFLFSYVLGKDVSYMKSLAFLVAVRLLFRERIKV